MAEQLSIEILYLEFNHMTSKKLLGEFYCTLIFTTINYVCHYNSHSTHYLKPL